MSSQVYLKITFPVAEPEQDLIIALLSEIGFESFEQEEGILSGYIPEDEFEVQVLENVLETAGLSASVLHRTERIEPKDWNEEWEKNWKNIRVDDFAEICAPFKASGEEVEYRVLIEPRMAFGTGHHATTRLMIRQLRSLEMPGKQVLDMGTGTGVLGILCALMGAKQVTGIDIDAWAVNNAEDNIRLNKISNMEVRAGGADAVTGPAYDIILANINRNVLLTDGAAYLRALKPGGTIVLSGFFEVDEPQIIDYFCKLGCCTHKILREQGWASVAFTC